MFNFLPMLKKDKITKKVNKLIKQSNKGSKYTDFTLQRNTLLKNIKMIHKQASVEDLINRRYYIENCLDNPYPMFVSLSISSIFWFCTEFLDILEKYSSHFDLMTMCLDTGNLLISMVIFMCFIVYFSIFLSTETRSYLKFYLKNEELESIESILYAKFDSSTNGKANATTTFGEDNTVKLETNSLNNPAQDIQDEELKNIKTIPSDKFNSPTNGETNATTAFLEDNTVKLETNSPNNPIQYIQEDIEPTSTKSK